MDVTLYSDSDWAGDKDTRISVSGYCIFLQDVCISWKSKGQKSVTLSSSEAELVALSEAAKELKFISQILKSMKIQIELPIKCYVDNVGAMFMAENVTTSSRSKHIDIRYHYLREFIEEGFIELKFVKTKENLADIFTKNVSGETLERHTPSFITKKANLKRQD